jgi:hypothetical protein
MNTEENKSTGKYSGTPLAARCDQYLSIMDAFGLGLTLNGMQQSVRQAVVNTSGACTMFSNHPLAALAAKHTPCINGVLESIDKALAIIYPQEYRTKLVLKSAKYALAGMRFCEPGPASGPCYVKA